MGTLPWGHCLGERVPLPAAFSRALGAGTPLCTQKDPHRVSHAVPPTLPSFCTPMHLGLPRHPKPGCPKSLSPSLFLLPAGSGRAGQGSRLLEFARIRTPI